MKKKSTRHHISLNGFLIQISLKYLVLASLLQFVNQLKCIVIHCPRNALTWNP